MKPSDDTRARVKALTEQLETGVKAVFESEKYTAYLKAMSKFHHYSFGNVMLILMQCPEASMVAGYTPGKTATISTTVYQLWRTNDDRLAFQWVMVNIVISAVVLLAVNMLEKKNRAVKRPAG